ncbi:lipocalin family protein [Barnesiella propionica]|uniref:lipocalin family protein n=1 Tax=Barnesiella propionica TaxID=2981781 RepID=UPI0011C84A9C|nr:lipocalin family protein [Barnesiella propionica]MCU6768391.1 lipocalin family protein [Barnesiella propionica]
MAIKSIFKRVSEIIIASIFTACSGTSIEGSWVEPVPDMDHMFQGIKIEAGGKASSINMTTLQYETWEKKGDKLILTGKSIGNHQTLSFSDTLTIEKLTQDCLILNNGYNLLKYSKAGKEEARDIIPASATPFYVNGELIIGHEVRSFMQKGDSIDYWIVDETGELTQKYDEVTKGTKNGTPVYAELKVINMGKSNDGFAAEYAGVYKVVTVLNVENNDPKAKKRDNNIVNHSITEDNLKTKLKIASGLGDLTARYFEGTITDNSYCSLIIYNYKHSGDGIFSISIINANKELFTTNGTVYTLKGENETTQWKCISNDGKETFYFLLDLNNNQIFWEPNDISYGKHHQLNLTLTEIIK